LYQLDILLAQLYNISEFYLLKTIIAKLDQKGKNLLNLLRLTYNLDNLTVINEKEFWKTNFQFYDDFLNFGGYEIAFETEILDLVHVFLVVRVVLVKKHQM